MFYEWNECVMSVLGTIKKQQPRAVSVLTLGNEVNIQLVRRHSGVFTEERRLSADLDLRSLPGWPVSSPHLLCI